MMNVLCVAKYADIFCLIHSVGRNMFVIPSYSKPWFETKNKLEHFNSNDSSNAIQQRIVTFEYQECSVVAARAVCLKQFP